MEENKTTVEIEETTGIETVEKDEVVEEVKTATKPQATTEVKKNNSRKYVAIFAIAFLALAIVAAAIVWVVLGGQRGEEPETPEEPEESYAQISIEDISKYTLICAAGTSNKTMTQYWKLQSKIKNMCGVKIVTETDNNVEAADFEILVGSTDREESKTFLSNLLWDDYGYAIVGNKIVIAGHTEEGTNSALKQFLEHLEGEGHETVFFSNKNQYLFRHPYISDTFMLNGIDVSRAKIIVNQESGSDLQMAKTLSEKSLALCGRSPKIVTDFDVKDGDSIIIIGISALVPDAMQAEWDASYATTEGKSAYYVGKADNVMWIYTSVMEGYGAINRELLPQIQPETATGATLSTGLVKLPQLFTVMSFNVFVSQFNTARKDRVVATIRENAPSIFGVQEANDNWMTALRADLGNEYASVGVGREANLKGEYSAIFYRKDLFTLVDSGTKWLSYTPDEAGSKYQIPGTSYVANCPRVMTYAVLERQTDGVQFLYVNTHLDHNGSNNETVASQIRKGQIEILLSQIEEVKQLHGELPTIVTGDFNVSPGASPYKAMTDGGYLDASRVTWSGEIQNTYNGMDDNYAGAIIDYIFVSPDLAEAVDSYIVCPAKRDDQWISDHNAIIASITLPVDDAQ